MAVAFPGTAFDEGPSLNVDIFLSDLAMPIPANERADIACELGSSCFGVSAPDEICVDFQSWVNLESDTPFLDSIVVV